MGALYSLELVDELLELVELGYHVLRPGTDKQAAEALVMVDQKLPRRHTQPPCGPLAQFGVDELFI